MAREWSEIGSTTLGLRLNTIRNYVTHMNFRLALRFPHRKHFVGLRWGPRSYRNLYWLVSEIILLIVVEGTTG